MKRTTIRLAALVLFFATGLAHADPITYVFSGVGSGGMGAATFTDAAFTITVLADTANIQTDITTGAPVGPGEPVNGDAYYWVEANSATVSIAGLGTFAVNWPTQPYAVFDDVANQVVAVGVFQPGAIYGEQVIFDNYDLGPNAAFASYALNTDFGPTAENVFFAGQDVYTSNGYFYLDGGKPAGTPQTATDGMFSATMTTPAGASVPEPSMPVLILTMLLGVAFLARERITRSIRQST